MKPYPPRSKPSPARPDKYGRYPFPPHYKADHPRPPDECRYYASCRFTRSDCLLPGMEVCKGKQLNCRMYRPNRERFEPCQDCRKDATACIRCGTFVSWQEWHAEERLRYQEENNLPAYP